VLHPARPSVYLSCASIARNMTACRNFKFDVDNSTVMKWLKMEYFLYIVYVHLTRPMSVTRSKTSLQ